MANDNPYAKLAECIANAGAAAGFTFPPLAKDGKVEISGNLPVEPSSDSPASETMPIQPSPRPFMDVQGGYQAEDGRWHSLNAIKSEFADIPGTNYEATHGATRLNPDGTVLSHAQDYISSNKDYTTAESREHINEPSGGARDIPLDASKLKPKNGKEVFDKLVRCVPTS